MNQNNDKEAYVNAYGVTSNNTLSNSNNNLVSEASSDESKNLTVSLPMTTSTTQAQGNHRLDAIRSVHNEQKTIEEEKNSLNSANENRTPGATNEKFSYSKPTNSNKAYSPNNSSGVPPVNNNGAAAATANGGTGKKSNGFVFVVAFAGALLACILAFALGSFFGLFGSKTVIGGSSTTIGSTSSSTVNASDTSANLAEAVSAKCLPSVVSINVYGTTTTSTGTIFDYLNGNSGSESTEAQTATGSGVVISKDGYVITNEHVTEDGTRYEVNVNGKTLEAKLVGSDSSSDVAVLKVDTDEELTAIELGDSDTIKTGEWVMSIGSPFGLEQSVATGIVSATSRSQIASTESSASSSTSVRIYPNMVQTDAAINPGNSGGALVNENGQLIGINTLIQSSSGNYSGVGFAIPVNYAIGIARDLIEGKTPTYAQLGVSCTSITETIAKRYGFGVSSGAYVSEVTSGSGADNAGIKKGDIITEFEGEQVTSSSDLTLDVRKKNAGDKVSVKLVRDGQEQTLEVTLGQGSSTSSSNSSNSQSQQNQQNQNGFGQQR